MSVESEVESEVTSQVQSEYGGREVFDEMGDPFIGAGVEFETVDGETVIGRVVKGVEGPEHTLVTVSHDGGEETELRWSQVESVQTKGQWTCTACGNYSEVPYKCSDCGKPRDGDSDPSGRQQ